MTIEINICKNLPVYSKGVVFIQVDNPLIKFGGSLRFLNGQGEEFDVGI